MSPTALALTGYVTWMLILIAGIEVLRTRAVLKFGRQPNTFAPDGSDVSPFANRLCRAHANCYESFPIIGGLLLFALATDRVSVTDSLALWVLAARIAQSLVHLASGSATAAQIRFAFFLVQLVVAVIWLARLFALRVAG
ncbi:MAPEG family protein [Cognatilysobacter bugurensis]|uniref:MAPEG family protein n=1 Tax=Cognatilysobacter bugurensis TaxID=543356 RepID=A0A918T3I9_9GAMM|nr:MAPEG family protein [Lysobacter bugurensis]GHA86350.1 hypothetical protein GCM10007067_25500 [Lysobacter bugurensis]